jgi:sortase A
LKVTVVLKMSSATKWMERCLWAIGFLALAAWFGVWFNARQQQAEGSRELERRLEAPRGTEASRAPSFAPRARLAQGELIGRIEIPRLHVSTIVFEGAGDNVLSVGVGHLSGTALPGDRGNVVLAAHRDTFFRPLRSVHKYDWIVVVTPAATRRYQVDSTAIVSPNYIEVLAPTPAATLTLVTCYPFEWFGHAPKRFIVRAHEVDDSNRSRAPVSAVNAQTRADDRETMAVADRLPLVHPPLVHAKRPTTTAARSQSEPVARHAGPAPVATGMEPAVLVEPTPSARENADVRASMAVQETAVLETREPALETDAPPQPTRNRMMRGLKKLNPKRLLAKIAGQ